MSSPTLPTLYDAADEASLSGQKWFLRARRTQLGSLLVAAVASLASIVLDRYDLAGFLGLAAFGVVLVAQVLLDKFQPQRAWYEGRMSAESIKHLAWKFAVRADPFVDDDGAVPLFIQRISETQRSVKDLKLPPADGDQITDWMRDLRSADVAARRSTYLTHRVAEQRDWYGRRSRQHAATARNWRIALYTAMVLGGLAGVCKALAITSLDLIGLAATAASGITAWVESKQFDTLVVAYSQASHELASVHDLAMSVDNSPGAWSNFVNDAEDAISREHRMWAASRTAKLGPIR